MPDVSNLQRDAILQSILDHISDYQLKDPLVKVETLKSSVISKVIDAPNPAKPEIRFDQEEQLRGFLKAFESTSEYSSQFKILDERTQEQIKTFKNKPKTWRDEPIWQDTHRKGFRLPNVNPEAHVLAKPTSSQTSRGGIKKFLLGAFVKVTRPLVQLFVKFRFWEAAKKLETTQARRYAHGPRIVEHEDKADAKPMDVCKDLKQRLGFTHIDRARSTQIYPLKTGANLSTILPSILLFPRPSAASRTSCCSPRRTTFEYAVAVTGTAGQRSSLKTRKSSFHYCLWSRSPCCRIR